MKFLLLIIILIAVVVLVGLGLVALGKRVVAYRDERQDRAELVAERNAAVANQLTAERYFRAIANGAGNPVLEAQEALDIIQNNPYNNPKELN